MNNLTIKIRSIPESGGEHHYVALVKDDGCPVFILSAASASNARAMARDIKKTVDQNGWFLSAEIS